jgi:hypothetical protein
MDKNNVCDYGSDVNYIPLSSGNESEESFCEFECCDTTNCRYFDKPEATDGSDMDTTFSSAEDSDTDDETAQESPVWDRPYNETEKLVIQAKIKKIMTQIVIYEKLQQKFQDTYYVTKSRWYAAQSNRLKMAIKSKLRDCEILQQIYVNIHHMDIESALDISLYIPNILPE